MNDENELRTENSLQSVKYLGKGPSVYAHGIQHILEPIRLIWNQSNKGRRYHRCALSIHRLGLGIYEEIADGTFKSAWSHPIEEISYCVAEAHHDRLFSWIARSKNSHQMECHLVLCKTRQRARFLADFLAKTFYESFQARQKKPLDFSPPVSIDCFVCETVARHANRSIDDNQQPNDDYERISLNLPVVNRISFENFDSYSIQTYSQQSLDYDATVADQESIRPMEFQRKD